MLPRLVRRSLLQNLTVSVALIRRKDGELLKSLLKVRTGLWCLGLPCGVWGRNGECAAQGEASSSACAAACVRASSLTALWCSHPVQAGGCAARGEHGVLKGMLERAARVCFATHC